MKLSFTLNGDPVSRHVDGGEALVDFLREDLSMVGTKWGCLTGDCGACTVLLDGRPVVSCLQVVAQLEGREVTTIEGVTPPVGLSPTQRAFVDHGATQCGFCTPGMIMAAEALVRSGTEPDEGAIREGLAGNLCRCTGYNKIIDAVLAVLAGQAGGNTHERRSDEQ